MQTADDDYYTKIFEENKTIEEIMEAMVVAEVERRMRQLERRKKVVVKSQEVIVEGDRDIDF